MNDNFNKTDEKNNYQYLDKVNSLTDLKALSKKELPYLAKDIRKFLVDNISKTGGHLAPNLGIVELTIAMHYIFNSPSDKIIFDVGHQCYVHKILTGRKNEFTTLRKLNGLSGFPKKRESEHDFFDTGHSSTSISTALGVATANKLDGKDDYTIAVIGDGALTGGLAFEALNNSRVDDTNLIVILNDNQMSISPSVGNLSNYLSSIRSNKFYTNAKMSIRNILKHIPLIGTPLINLLEFLKNGLRHLLLPKSVLFEQFGFTYLGPIDGHEINDLLKILSRAKKVKKPVLLHVVTRKGKGYKPSEEKPDLFHGVGTFCKETGETTKSKSLNYSKKFGEKLVSLAKENKKIVAITAAMPDGTGLNEFSKEFPDRFFDVGIAEEHATTFAGGLASQGYIPFFAVYSTFLQRSYDEIIHDVALQKAHVIFAIDRAGIVGQDGETHQGIFDLSYLSHIPNIILLAPRDGQMLEKMMDYAVSYNGPVAIRYPRDGYVEELIKPTSKNKLPTKFALNSDILVLGTDLTILGYGKTVKTALEVSKILRKTKRIKSEVIDVKTLKPLDKETILKSIRKTKRVITIEDNIIAGGLATAIKDLIIDEEINYKNFFAYPDEFIKHGKTEEIEKEYGLDAESISKKIKLGDIH